MHDTILTTSGFGVAVGIAVVAILVNKGKNIFTTLKISIILFAIDWIILSAFFSLGETIPLWCVRINGSSFNLFEIIIWIILLAAQILLLIGFYASSVAIGKDRISEAGSDEINNGAGTNGTGAIA